MTPRLEQADAFGFICVANNSTYHAELMELVEDNIVKQLVSFIADDGVYHTLYRFEPLYRTTTSPPPLLPIYSHANRDHEFAELCDGVGVGEPVVNHTHEWDDYSTDYHF